MSKERKELQEAFEKGYLTTNEYLSQIYILGQKNK